MSVVTLLNTFLTLPISLERLDKGAPVFHKSPISLREVNRDPDFQALLRTQQTPQSDPAGRTFGLLLARLGKNLQLYANVFPDRRLFCRFAQAVKESWQPACPS